MQDTDIEFTLVPKLDAGAVSAVVRSLDAVLDSIGGIDLISDESRKQIDEARKGLKSLADALPEDSFDDAAKGLDKVDEAGKRVEQTVNKAFQANQAIQFAREMSNMVAELSQPFVALDTATQQLKTLGAEAAAMAPNLREAAISMSKDLPFAAAELQTTMFDALASGVKGGEEGLKAFADTAAKLAVGGGSSIGAATNLLAGNLNAYGKSAEEAAKFSDIFFNTINFGVTSAEELSNTLSNVVPTAAAAGIELEGVGASLAVMTSKGIPTAQATTKLNALLLELQKPAADLAPILKEAGVSLESLKNDDLPVTLGKVSDALRKAGKASVEVFSSSEAGAAFATLAGDLTGFTQTFEDVRDTAGSAQNAYNEMSGSIQTQTDQMLSSVNAFVIEGMDTIGPSFVTAAQGATQLAPMVTTLTGLGSVIPDGLITRAKDLAGSLGGPLVGGLKSMGGAITSALPAMGGMLASLGPLGVGIAAVAAAVALGVAAYALFSSKTKDLAEAQKDASDALAKTNQSIERADATKKQTDQLEKLAAEYDKLKTSTDPLSQKKFAETTEELAKRVPAAADAIGDLKRSGAEAGVQFRISTAAVKEYADEQQRLADSAAADALADMDAQSRSLQESIVANTEKIAELRAEREGLSGDKEGGIFGNVAFDIDASSSLGLQFAEWTGLIGDSKAELKDVQGEINKLSPELQAARDQQMKQIQGYAEMGFTIDEVAEKLGTTKEALDLLTPPDFKTSIVNVDAFKTAIDGLSEAQQQNVNKAVNTAEAYQKAQAEVDVINGKLADAQFGGDKDLEAKLTEDLAKAQKVADEKKMKLSTVLDDEDTKKALEGLPEKAKELMKPINASITFVNDEKALKETQAKAGSILREISELQTAQADAAGTANEKIYSEKVLGKQAEFRANLIQQAEVLGANTAKLNDLKAAKEKATDPAEVKRLSGEIVTMEKTITAGAKQFENAAASGKRLGAVKGDVKELGSELKLSDKAALGVAESAKRIQEESKKAAAAAGDIGAAFEAAQKQSSDVVNKLASTYAANLIELQGVLDEQRAATLRAQNKSIEEEARKINADIRAGRSAIDSARQALGFNVEADAKKAEDERKKREAEQKKRREEEEARKRDAAAFAAEQRNERRKAAASEIEDEFTRSLAILRSDKKLSDDRIAIDRRKANLTASERQEINQREAEANRKYAADVAAAEKTALKQYGIDLLRVRTDILTQQAAEYRAQAAEITGEDVRSVRLRGELVAAAMERESEAKLNREIESNAAFDKLVRSRTEEQARLVLEANTKFVDASLRADAEVEKRIEAQRKAVAEADREGAGRVVETKTPEQIRAEVLSEAGFADFEAARKVLIERKDKLAELMVGLREDVRDALTARERTVEMESLLTQMIPDEAERARLIGAVTAIVTASEAAAETERQRTAAATKQAQLQARLSTITEVAERERVQKEIEATKTLEADLRAIGNAEIALAERKLAVGGLTPEEEAAEQAKIDRAKEIAARKHVAIMNDIATERRADEDPIFNAVLTLAETQWRDFFGAVDEMRLEDLEKQKEANTEALIDLEASYRRGEISIEAYYDKRRDLAAKEKELNDEIAANQFDIWKGLEKAGASAFEKIAAHQKEESDASLEEFKATGKGYGDVAESVGLTLAATATQLTLTLAAEGAELDEILSEIGNLVVSTAFDVLQAMVPIWSAQILAGSLATPASILTAGGAGVVQWLAMTGLMQGAISLARASLGKLFKEGGYTGDGDPDEIAGLAHKQEYYHTAEVTKVPENRALFEHLHDGGSLKAFAESFPEIFGLVGYDDEPNVAVIDYAIIKELPDDLLGLKDAMKHGNDPAALLNAHIFFDISTDMKDAAKSLRSVDQKLSILDDINERVAAVEKAASAGSVQTKNLSDQVGAKEYGASIAGILRDINSRLSAIEKKQNSWRNNQ